MSVGRPCRLTPLCAAVDSVAVEEQERERRRQVVEKFQKAPFEEIAAHCGARVSEAHRASPRGQRVQGWTGLLDLGTLVTQKLGLRCQQHPGPTLLPHEPKDLAIGHIGLHTSHFSCKKEVLTSGAPASDRQIDRL